MDREELNRRFEELGSRVGAAESQSHAVAVVMPAVESAVADSGGPDEEFILADPSEEPVLTGDVTLHGTDVSELTGDDFTFASAADSNVVVKLEETTGADAKRKIEIGVYYV